MHTSGPPEPRRRHWGRWILTAALAVTLLLVIIALAGQPKHSAAAPGATASAAPPAADPGATASQAPASPSPAARDTVTLVVYGDGSPVNVTYGPAGSTATGREPMTVTQSIPASPPIYYSINAQLQGTGSVSVVIKVNGKQIFGCR